MEDKDITLEDVEIALSIINAFLSKVNRVNITLQKLKALSKTYDKSINPYNMSFQDFLNLAIALDQKKKESINNINQNVEQDNVIPPEDIEKMKELVNRFKNKNKQS